MASSRKSARQSNILHLLVPQYIPEFNNGTPRRKVRYSRQKVTGCYILQKICVRDRFSVCKWRWISRAGARRTLLGTPRPSSAHSNQTISSPPDPQKEDLGVIQAQNTTTSLDFRLFCFCFLPLNIRGKPSIFMIGTPQTAKFKKLYIASQCVMAS